jgi:Zn-dependent protease
LSTITHSIVSNCPKCSSALPLQALVCPQCQTLVYSRELETLAREARDHESNSEFAQARELWNQSLTLLPSSSKQAEWVRERMRALEGPNPVALTLEPSPASSPATSNLPAEKLLQSQPPQSQPPQSHPWLKRLGPLGPFALLLLKFKTLFLLLFKLKFLFSFLFFIALYVGLFGWRYGVGISVCILIHEMGHYIDVKRRGLPAEMPVFLPGFGAYVRWTALGVTRRQIAQISLAGPLAGWVAAAVCFLLYAQTGDPIWAALARTGAVLNILNLIPVWMLDGGQAIGVLSAVERAALLAAALGLWYYTGEGIFFFVAAGTVWRLFTKDKPEQSDWSTWAYYAALLVALAVILHATPNAVANGAVMRP